VGPGEDALMARIRAKEEEKKRKKRLLLAASSGSNAEEVVVIGGGEKGNLTSDSSSGHHRKSNSRRSSNTSGDDDKKDIGGVVDSAGDAAAVTKRSSRVLNLYEGHTKGEEEEETPSRSRKTTEKKEEESRNRNHMSKTKVNNKSSSSLIKDKIRSKQKDKTENNDKEEKEEGVVLRSSRKLDLHATSSSTRTSTNNNIVRLDSIQESVVDNNNDKEEAILDAKIRAKIKQGSSSSRRQKETKDEEKVDENENDNENENARNNNKSNDSGISSGIPIIPPTPPTTTRVLRGEDVRARMKQQKKSKRKLLTNITNEEDRLDPLRAAEEQRKANAKPLNPKFADMYETGSWGSITRMEKCALLLLVIGSITTAIVLGYKFGHVPSTSAPTVAPTKLRPIPPTNPPTMSPTGIDFRTKYGFEVLRNTSNKLSLPNTVDELVGAKTNPESTPQMIAAEYVLFDDPILIDVRDTRFLERYAIIVFYYQNGGCSGNWLVSTNWMTNTDHCTGKWHGIECDLTNHVIEIQLSKNYITGRIPIELQNLGSLIALDLSNNALTGAVPYEAVSTNTTYTIQLNNNLLSGEFPFEEIRSRSPILGNLWIQENTDLMGTITEDYCNLESITLDCDNYSPQPVYPAIPYVPPGAITADISITTFQQNCYEQGLVPPREYTCNFDDPVPYTKSPVSVPTTSAAVAICGVPSPV
jgi:hypothetical protein